VFWLAFFNFLRAEALLFLSLAFSSLNKLTLLSYFKIVFGQISPSKEKKTPRKA